MKLPLPSLLGSKKKPEYFLTLLLRDDKASAVVIEEYLGKIKIIAESEQHFPVSIEDAEEKELLEILDRTISAAEETLPSDIEITKTVFGVKESWVEQKRIKKEYLLRLKKICDELDLSPIGFLVTSEAIAHLLQEEEGAPLSAVLVEIGKNTVTLSLFRGGKLVETHAADIVGEIHEQVDGMLKHFTGVEVLPSRIIIFDGDRQDSLSQQFITHQWSKSLPFLHVPQVAILPKGFDARSIVFGAATQLGFSVASQIFSKDIHDAKVISKTVQEKTPDEKESLQAEQEPDTVEKEVETTPKDDFSEAVLENFGFVTDEDISDTDDSKEEHAREKVDDREETHREPLPIRHHTAHQSIPSHAVADDHDNEDTTHNRRMPTMPQLSLGSLSVIPKAFASLVHGMLRLPGMERIGKTRLMIFIPLILLVLIGVLYLYIFKLGATVTLDLEPRPADDEQSIVFSTADDNDFSNNVIAAKLVSASLSGTATTDATGKKDVGEKAKGAVTIFNSDDASRRLPQGTIITSGNDLNFVMDKDVTVASASGDIFSGIKSGTTKVEVTAEQIGTEYNLPSNTTFTVGTNSSLAARNEGAFSGGSKKTVTVVAKKDIDKLTQDFPKGLEGKAREELQKKIEDDEAVIPIFIEQEFDKRTFDHDVDDEAKSVKLSATIAFKHAVYKKSDLLSYSQTVLKNKFDESGTIPDESINTEFKNLKVGEDGDVSANLTINAGLLPKLDEKEIVKTISGKSFDEARNILLDLPQVKNAEMNLSPNIPFLPKTLPRFDSNITLVINTNE